MILRTLRRLKLQTVSHCFTSSMSSAAPPEQKIQNNPETDDDGQPAAKKLKPDNEEPGDSHRQLNEAGERLKKKKVALLMSYNGKGYYGMQFNTGYATIEDELITALHKAGLIPLNHRENPSKMQFQRAARTDKGVSAAMQVVSLKLWVNVENALQKVNELLPAQIRVVDFKRTTQSFNCKNSCSHRTYTYFLPTYAFTPVEENKCLKLGILFCETRCMLDWWGYFLSKMVLQSFRLGDPDKTIGDVNEVLTMYKGTHNFHNFTSGKKPDEASSMRYIIDMHCSAPFIQDGFEWAVITVKGQSFMLHQIRKMIGLMIAIIRGLASIDVIAKAWGPAKVDVPKAPGLGLMLEQVHYDSYNKKHGHDGMHEPLIWDNFKEQIEAFKKEHIYSSMIETEKAEKEMLKWLSTLFCHHFDYRVNVELPSDAETAIGRAAHLVKLDDKKRAAESEKDNSVDGDENNSSKNSNTLKNVDSTHQDSVNDGSNTKNFEA